MTGGGASTAVEAAMERAEAARRGEVAPPGPRPVKRWVVAGDPQTSTRRFMEVLDAHRAIDAEGWLAPGVGLVSVGDHFDYRQPPGVSLEEVGAEGERILSWLAAHGDDRVRVLLGNHDLCRVMELASVTDDSFAEARALAVAIRDREAEGESAKELRARFAAEHPEVPTPGLAARDYSAFSESQRSLVQRILLRRRARLACVIELGSGTRALATHAGVTERELRSLGLPNRTTVEAIASALDERLERAVEAVRSEWEAGGRAALDLSPVHEMGREGQEGGGLLYHRPAHPDRERSEPRGPSRARRRYPPTELPRGITQISGHVDHAKCMQELAGYDLSRAAVIVPGSIRELRVDAHVQYGPFALPAAPAGPTEGVVVFVDGGMNAVEPSDYHLLEVRGVA